MDVALLMGVRDVGRKHLQPHGLAHGARGEVPLGVEDVAVFVGIFVDHRGVFAHQRDDRVVDVGGLDPGEVPLRAVADVGLGEIVFAALQQRVLDNVLHFVDLDVGREPTRDLPVDIGDDVADRAVHQRGHPLVHTGRGLDQGVVNFGVVERHPATVSLDNLDGVQGRIRHLENNAVGPVFYCLRLMS